MSRRRRRTREAADAHCGKQTDQLADPGAGRLMGTLNSCHDEGWDLVGLVVIKVLGYCFSFCKVTPPAQSSLVAGLKRRISGFTYGRLPVMSCQVAPASLRFIDRAVVAAVPGHGGNPERGGIARIGLDADHRAVAGEFGQLFPGVSVVGAAPEILAAAVERCRRRRPSC